MATALIDSRRGEDRDASSPSMQVVKRQGDASQEGYRGRGKVSDGINTTPGKPGRQVANDKVEASRAKLRFGQSAPKAVRPLTRVTRPQCRDKSRSEPDLPNQSSRMRSLAEGGTIGFAPMNSSRGSTRSMLYLPQTPGIALGCPRSCFRWNPRAATGLSCDGDSLDRFSEGDEHGCIQPVDADEHGCIQPVDAGGETTRRREPRGVSGTWKVSPTGSIPHRENPAGNSPMTRSKPLGPSFASGSQHQRQYGH